jgi:hypothetical protein
MAVPSGNNHLRNTSGGAFTEQTQGGTVLGNQTLSLVANSVGWTDGVLPRVLNNGLSHNQKALSAGTFAYAEAGKYVIRTISDTLSGVSKTNILIPGSDVEGRRPIHKFRHDFGAKLLTKWRANQFSWVGTSGARHNWVDASNAAEVPATLSTTNMYDISDGNASDMAADSAAEPTRAIPGELVLKVDFVTTNVSTGGDFFDYKPITG